ncbi:MAG: DNA repair exonuclease [Theionarchaea archaeon]|nr:DNA repair exonuclease [Theionarchaea archaeon]MBU6999484.1 DNA repair exonuclease [Theionarchaea archaeon]MBU7034119.1 DNA repair exonuclease [Theionarchaea archaeon]MBU7041354.1 DNA repair exonuclease [Theionarchaea archaeon]
MVRIVHIADVHLGYQCKNVGDKSTGREQDFLHSFQHVVDYCCDPANHVDALVIAGDLFDMADPPSSLVGFVQRTLSSLRQHGILVVAVPGTHDAYGYKSCVYRKGQLEGMHILTSFNEPLIREVSGEKVFFYGAAYIPGGNETLFESFSPFQEEGIHIGIIHGSVGLPAHWERRGQDFQLEEHDIARSHLDYVALGHFHNFKQIQCGTTLAVYPGSLEGRDFSESGERYMVVVDFRGKTPHITPIAVNTRTVKAIDINLENQPLESVSDVIDHIARNYRDPASIVSLNLQGRCQFPLDLEYVRQALGDSFFYLQLKDSTTIVDSTIVSSWKEERTIRGMYVTTLLRKIAQAQGEEKAILEEALKIGVASFMEASP